MKSHSLIACLILTVGYLSPVQAVTDAELEALEKQIDQLELEEKKQAEAAAKRKAEQKRKAEAEAEKKRFVELEKQRQEEQRRLEEEKRKLEEARLETVEQQRQEAEAKRLAEEEQKREEEIARSKITVLQSDTTDWFLSGKDYAKVNNLTFEVGMGNAMWGYGYAGAEIMDANILEVQVDAPQTYKHYDANSFAGFIIDYFDGNKNIKRVMLGIGMLDKNRWSFDFPSGKDKKADSYYDLGQAPIYFLDLQKWAPENWDGRIWFTLGIQNGGHGNAIKAVILEN